MTNHLDANSRDNNTDQHTSSGTSTLKIKSTMSFGDPGQAAFRYMKPAGGVSEDAVSVSLSRTFAPHAKARQSKESQDAAIKAFEAMGNFFPSFDALPITAEVIAEGGMPVRKLASFENFDVGFVESIGTILTLPHGWLIVDFGSARYVCSEPDFNHSVTLRLGRLESKLDEATINDIKSAMEANAKAEGYAITNFRAAKISENHYRLDVDFRSEGKDSFLTQTMVGQPTTQPDEQPSAIMLSLSTRDSQRRDRYAPAFDLICSTSAYVDDSTLRDESIDRFLTAIRKG
jgi:hypothetical protein